MLQINQINTNNKIISEPKKKNKDVSDTNTQCQQTSSKEVYASGELLKVMTGVSVANKNTPKQTKDNSEQLEQINQYLHSLPICGKVISAYEQDEEGKTAIQGLVTAMSKNDVETSNVEMLIDLIENKKVKPLALLYLCKQGIMSDEFESDVDKIYDAYINNKDIKDTFVPTLKNRDEAINSQKIGDVFQIGDEENIYIKTSDNDIQQLQMSGKMYLKLFPPMERFALYQGEVGNCYMLSTIEAMNSNPKTRVNLLNCFKEDGDNLKISLPNSDYEFVMPKNIMPSEIKENPELYTMGAPGFKILEHVYGKDVQNSLLNEAHQILQEQSTEAKGFFTKRMFKKQLAEFEKNLAENPDDIIISRKLSNQKVDWNETIGVDFKKLSEEHTAFKRASDYYRGRGGHEEWVMQRFGIPNTEKIFDFEAKNFEKLQQLFFAPENKDEYIFTASSHISEESPKEGLVNADYGVYSKHSFSVKPKIDKDGNQVLHVSNPWNSSQSSVLTLEKFCELYSCVIAAKI